MCGEAEVNKAEGVRAGGKSVGVGDGEGNSRCIEGSRTLLEEPDITGIGGVNSEPLLSRSRPLSRCRSCSALSAAIKLPSGLSGGLNKVSADGHLRFRTFLPISAD